MGLLSSTPATTTTTQKPWSAQAPYLKKSFNEANQLYNENKGFNPFPGSTVAPFSAEQQQGMGGIMSAANWGNPLGESAQQQELRLLNNGGMTQMQRQALDPIMGLATNDINSRITTGPEFRALMGETPSAMQQYTSGIAGGQQGVNTEGNLRALMGQTDNPYYQGVVQRQSDLLANDISRQMEGIGAFHSGANQSALAQQLGDFRDTAMSNQWNANNQMQRGLLGDIAGVQGTNLGNVMNAAQGISSEQQNAIADKTGLLANITGVQTQNRANQLAASGLINNAVQGATGNTLAAINAAPGVYNQQYQPYERMMDVGNLNQDMARQNINDQLRIYEGKQSAPWERLGAFNTAVSGSGYGGTTNTTAQQPSSLLGSVIGGGTLGAQIGGGTGAVAGAAGGGLLEILKQLGLI